MGMPAMSAEELDEKYKELEESMSMLDYFLKDGNKFLAGNEVSVADIFIANEVNTVNHIYMIVHHVMLGIVIYTHMIFSFLAAEWL